MEKKTILIRSFSRGVEKATAFLAKQKGYQVILHEKTFPNELQKVQEQILHSSAVVFDVANQEVTHEVLPKLLEEIAWVDTTSAATIKIGSIFESDVLPRIKEKNLVG